MARPKHLRSGDNDDDDDVDDGCSPPSPPQVKRRCCCSIKNDVSTTMTNNKRALSFHPTLREDDDWNDFAVVPEQQQNFNDETVMMNNNERQKRYLLNYYSEPPNWDESPRSSMYIITLPEPPQIPVVTQQLLSRHIIPGCIDEVIPNMKKKKKKIVRFTTIEQNKVHIIDYSTSATHTWYNRTEYTNFKDDLKDTIIQLYRNKGQLHLLNPNQYTITGLERSLTHRQIIARKQFYKLYIQMMKQHQQQLYQNDYDYNNDPTIQLRNVSLLFTSSATRRAQIRGGMIEHDLLIYPTTTTARQQPLLLLE